ncbi:hypothetical protein GCM10027184_69460 [Saccharothrix stipae]
MGDGGEGGVAVPSDPGAAFEVVRAEAVFEFAVVVLDAPPDLGDPDQIAQPDVVREGGQPVVGGFGDAGGPFREQPSLRKAAVRVARDVPVGRTHPHATNRDRIRPVELAGLLWEPWRRTANFPADRPAAVTSGFRSIGGSG